MVNPRHTKRGSGGGSREIESKTIPPSAPSHNRRKGDAIYHATEATELNPFNMCATAMTCFVGEINLYFSPTVPGKARSLSVGRDYYTTVVQPRRTFMRG